MEKLTPVTPASFVHGSPVPSSHFIGRRREVDQILSQLANPARGSSAISGDPRVGKTSLLHYLREPHVRETWGLAPSWCHFLYLDAHSVVPFTEAAFWRYLLRELGPYLNDDEALSGRVQQLLAQAGPDVYDLNSLFDHIARAGRLVVLALDEFEGIVENLDPHSPGLLYHLRALLNRPERGLALVLTSREPLKQLCAGFRFAGSPFDNVFWAITLPPFSEAEVDQLLARYQADLSSAERDYLRQIAGTHPYLVQLAASLTMRARGADAASTLLFAQIEADLERETEGYFADLLDYSNEFEKMLLALLALTPLNQHLPADKARLGDLTSLFGRYHQDLSRLMKRGLVLDQPDGPTLFSLIFGRWILRRLIIAGGGEVLSGWEPHYAKLSSAQKETLKELVDKVIRWPAIVKTPELLAQVSIQDEASQDPPSPSLSVPNLPEAAGASHSVEDLTPHRPIQISGAVLLSGTQGAVIKQLYLESSQPLISRVHLDQALKGGLSGTQVILAQPIDERGRGLAREVIKIGPATMLRREYHRYRQFVKGRLPATAVALERGPVEWGDLGCLSYGFAGDRPPNSVQDLEDYYAAHRAGIIIETLARLMEPLDARWYGQSEPLLTTFAEEYGQQLPDHLRVRAERISPNEDFNPGPYRLIDIETILTPGEKLNIGEQVAIRDLQISQVMPDTIKLHTTGDGPTIWVRAKIARPRPDLQEQDRVSLLGVVEARRDDVLTTAIHNALQSFPGITRLSDGMLRLEGLEHLYPDPLRIYPRALRQQLDGRRAIIHGDLHPGNILIDESGRSWLIDFDHVREGHVLYDFIRLETLLRLFILGGVRRFKQESQGSPSRTDWPHPFTLAEYAAFEAILVQQTLDQSAKSIPNPDLAKAAEVILAIRRLAQPYLRTRQGWSEYLIGLFLHNLAQLRFYQDQPQFGIFPFTTAALVGREASRLAGW